MPVLQIQREHRILPVAVVAAVLLGSGCVWQPQTGDFGPVLIPPGRVAHSPEGSDRTELPVSVAPAAADPAALRSPSPQVRLEALQAWRGSQSGELPVEAIDLRSDPDARVRAAAMPVLAASGHPQAEEYLAAALEDHELKVRLAAVAALGSLSTDSARERLKILLTHDSELIRAAAVAALASQGEERVVLDAASDESWRVRLAVAESLHQFSSRRAATTAMEMLEDSSAAVQQQAVASIGHWPLERSGPILLEAMDKIVYGTRKSAAEQLARCWPAAGQFPVDGPPERRQEVLERLRQEFRRQIGFVGGAAAVDATAPASDLSPQRVAKVDQLVQQVSDPASTPATRQQAIAELRAFGPGVSDVFDQWRRDRQQALPEVVYREVLSPISPPFAALEDLKSDDPAVRRRAAGRLVEISMKQPLPGLAVVRLAELAVAETDSLIWQSLLTAVATDGSEAATRLAAAAISHPAPEVRRRACEHLAAHPDPRHVALLLPVLKDPHETTAAAAARALGRVGHLDDTSPLRQLLASANEMVRLETAVALAGLGDEAGEAALERLSYSDDDAVRRGVAVAMGEVPRPVFVPALIRLLDDRHSIRVAALASLPKVVGHDVAAPVPHLAERIQLWKRWHAQGGDQP